MFKAVVRPDNAACRAIGHEGACWGVIAEKYRLILFGRFPYEEQWRPLIATVLMVALIAASCYRAFWKTLADGRLGRRCSRRSSC